MSVSPVGGGSDLLSMLNPINLFNPLNMIEEGSKLLSAFGGLTGPSGSNSSTTPGASGSSGASGGSQLDPTNFLGSALSSFLPGLSSPGAGSKT